MFRTAISFAVLPVALFTLSAPVAATTGAEAIGACQAALQSQGASRFEGADYRFRTIRGAARKRVIFRMTYNGQTETAECFYEGGEVSELVWPSAFTQAPAASE